MEKGFREAALVDSVGLGIQYMGTDGVFRTSVFRSGAQTEPRSWCISMSSARAQGTLEGAWHCIRHWGERVGKTDVAPTQMARAVWRRREPWVKQTHK